MTFWFQTAHSSEFVHIDRHVLVVDGTNITPRVLTLQPLKTAPMEPVRPSEKLFRKLAVSNPNQLIDLMRSGELAPGLVARAAEALPLGECTSRAVGVLVDLLNSEHLYVQEASLNALAAFDTIASHNAIERFLERSSLHPTLREIATELLADGG